MRPLDAAERLRRGEWEVRAVDDAIAERIFADFHYAAGAPKQHVSLHGLFPRDAFFDAGCRGAALWLPPTRAVALSLAYTAPNGVLALSRLAVDPWMAPNAATFLLAASMRAIDRARWPVFVTYADSLRGHSGAIYRATGWAYDGLTAPKPVYVRRGRIVSPKRGPRTLTHAEMLAAGAECIGRFYKRRFVHRATA